jgi:hypothetical protein
MHPMQIQAAHAEQKWIQDMTTICTHQITMHTNQNTYGIKPSTMQQRMTNAKQALRYFVPRFNRAMTGNGWRRNADYIPVIIPALEGTLNTYDKNRTLHWHILIGNLPKHIETDNIQSQAQRIWSAHEYAKDNINTSQLWHAEGFAGYTTKEHKQGNFECVEAALIQLPKHTITT